MATRVPGVLGGFIHIDAAIDAVRALRKAGYQDVTVYSAAPNHELEEALGTGSSWVRAFTLFGGLTGCAAGYAMTTWMQTDDLVFNGQDWVALWGADNDPHLSRVTSTGELRDVAGEWNTAWSGSNITIGTDGENIVLVRQSSKGTPRPTSRWASSDDDSYSPMSVTCRL